MFEGAGGERVTLYIGGLRSRRRTAPAGETAFRFAADDPVPSFYWVDHGFGYALAGKLPREALLALATAVYRHGSETRRRDCHRPPAFLQPRRNFMKLLSASILAAALLAGCGSMSTAHGGRHADQHGRRRADGPTGMTLYTFARDTEGSGKSACNGPCATNWPPLMAPDSAKPMGAYTVVTRDDGKKQWAYKGWPLYYWVKDTKAGDSTGDGVTGVWKIARP